MELAKAALNQIYYTIFLFKWETLVISMMCEVVPFERGEGRREKQLPVQVQEDDPLCSLLKTSHCEDSLVC